MNTTNNAPPWPWYRAGKNIYACNGAIVIATLSYIPGDSMVANGDLMAAAPDLLAACKAALPKLSESDDYAKNLIVAAIAKAEGKPALSVDHPTE